ncbi:MAG TPA: two-component regulator propeller domain-containing protein [Rudaea sp.]|nr:two-component regulator propeller domain-containing protein [Rudaea sp.]
MRILFSLLLLGLSAVAIAQDAASVPAVADTPARAAASASVFRPMGGSRPFRAEIITEVMLDKIGFLWIGTREGLYMYDGQRYRNFQHEIQSPDSISSNGIRGIFEDSRGRLWVNTISGGLNLLDRTTWRFRSWRHQRNDPQSLSHDGVFALAEAADGKLWVGTQAGLDLFDPDKGTFTHEVLATGGEFVMTLLTDADGRLWVGTLGQGLFRQSADRSSFNPVPGSGEHSPLDVFSLAHAAAGGVWVGTRKGLFRVKADDDRIVDPGLSSAAASAPLPNVTDLLPSADGGLWIGTFGNGLIWLAASSHTLVTVPLGPTVSGAQYIDQGALALDRDGALLVGTFGAGLLRTSARIAGLQTWRARDDNQPGLSNQDVYALLAESGPDPAKAGLLAGSFGGGIDAIDAISGAVTPWDLPVSAALRVRLSGITDLLRDAQGNIWAATNEGVYRWNRATGSFRYYPPDQAAGPSANPGYSFALLRDREDRIWVGTGGGGLYLYLPASDRFRNFRPVARDPKSLSDDFVTVIIEDRRGRLWIGTRSGGISICRFATELACSRIASGLGARDVSHDHITSLLQDAESNVWVGTAGGGLNRLALDADGNVESVRVWTRNDGLADDNVMALVFAPDGALWLSTHGGISRLNPETGKLTNLTPGDGLPTAVFNPKAAVLYRDRLYFGSAKGVVALDPAQAERTHAPPPTVIESIAGLDAEHRPGRPAWRLDALTVPWRRPFSLEFAVLGYDEGSAQFQYRLGQSEDWINLGDRGQLTLHALAPGHHRLEVRGRRGGNAWTLARTLNLDIVPPWWRRTTVQAAGVALALLLVTGLSFWRVRELETRNRELKRVHHLREQALNEAHSSRDQLQRAFAMLRRMTMRLEAAKEDERKHLARELHDEFGQALTGAKINLGLALARASGVDAEARISDTIGVLEVLIGQVRALSLDLRPPLLDEMGLVPALEAYLQAVALRSGIPIRSELDTHLPPTDVKLAIAVFRIVQEAVTNALRHSGAHALAVTLGVESGGVNICIRDDGKGFDAAAVVASGGPGLGLFGMRERVHDLGGSWSVESQPGRGTAVAAFIPHQETTSGEIA